MPVSVKDVISAAKPREVPVTVCVAGDLMAEFDRVDHELAQAAFGVAKLDSDRKTELESRLADLQRLMGERTFEFVFKQIDHYDFRRLLDAHPAREGKNEDYNQETLPAPLVAACCAEPAFDDMAQAEDLFHCLADSQVQALTEAAFAANRGEPGVPKSLFASVAIRGTESS